MTKFVAGWMPSPPDPRDRMYSASPENLNSLPARFDCSTPSPGNPFDPSWNQGQLGSCGPHSIGADKVFDLLRLASGGKVKMPSRLFIYYITRLVMGTVNQDSGVTNRDMFKALARYGWCDEELWPYNISRFRERPPAACWDQAAQRIGYIEYLAVPQNLQAMKACIASGDPFVFGYMVYSSSMSSAVSRTGDIPLPGMFDARQGGHDVLVVGYDDASQRFKIKNSWGTGWGKSGYGTIPYAYATNPRLAGDFWTVRLKGTPFAPPTPSPGPQPPPQPSTSLVEQIVKLLEALLKMLRGA